MAAAFSQVAPARQTFGAAAEANTAPAAGAFRLPEATRRYERAALHGLDLVAGAKDAGADVALAVLAVVQAASPVPVSSIPVPTVRGAPTVLPSRKAVVPVTASRQALRP